MPRLDEMPQCRFERMPMGLRRPAIPGGAGRRITSDIQMCGDRRADRAVRSSIRRAAAKGRAIMKDRPADSLAAPSGFEGRRLLPSKTRARRGQRKTWGKP